MNIETINFEKGNGLIPAVVQDAKTKDVLMVGFMNEEALALTIDTKWVHFWSRSRNKIWLKGEKSGNKLKVLGIIFDCDNDSLLVEAELIGKNVCHTGSRSCFFNKLV
ncbi:MAG: phosphoribosyl-AMP cyclohydrolase [Patescibacteria group bacterium]